MKADGAVIIDTKLATDGMNQGFAEIKSGAKSVADEARKAASSVNSSFSKMDFSRPVEIARAKVESLEQKLAAITAEYKIALASDDDRAAARLGARRTAVYDQMIAARKRLEIETTAAANRQATAEEKAQARAAAAAARTARKTERETAKRFAKLTAVTKTFGKRLTRILSSAFVFSALYMGLRKVTEYLGKALKSNKQFTESWASLKASLLTAFQPIYEFLLPAILAFMNVAKKFAQVIGNIFAALSGKTSAQAAQNAKALYEQANATEKLGKEAKKATKSIAGFDEIQKLSEPNTETATENTEATTPNFSEMMTEEYQAKIDKLTTYVSMALLALGAVLAFSGVNIPLGIALLALGAAGLASQIATNWSGVQDAVSGEAGAIIAILSGLLLALGAVLAFSGANIALGIGLMAVGATGLGTAIAANWDTIAEALRGPVGEIVAIVSGALLVLGAVLAFSGAGIGLGIGLMVAGAVGLATVAAVNWDTIGDKVKSVIASILAILSGASVVLGILLCLSGAFLPLGLALIFAGIKGTTAAANMSDNPVTRFVKNVVNTILGFINMLIDGINRLFEIDFPGLTIAGVEIIPRINTRLLNIPKIPLLAEGAVIPPNAPFAAILGDQRHGTNIEAPLSTIQEAVALVMEDYAAANIAGHEATVAVLRDILEAVLGIHIGDDVIGQAVARYNAKIAIIKGGVV